MKLLSSVKEGIILIIIIVYRTECYAHCVNDNFPFLSCKRENVSLTYYGNSYNNFYYYPKKNSDDYSDCHKYIQEV